MNNAGKTVHVRSTVLYLASAGKLKAQPQLDFTKSILQL
jgi:hypothetical protein